MKYVYREKDEIKTLDFEVSNLKNIELSNKHLVEIKRLLEMLEIENVYNSGITMAGIDEAGRGALAGPVVCSCVILPKNTIIEGVNDSKKVSEKKRDKVFELINLYATEVSVAMESPKVIDEINILQATFSAMKNSAHSLINIPELLLVDGDSKIKDLNESIKQITIVSGDQKSQTIAAASIIAKVTRDKLMIEFDKIYPNYQFSKHKGYGTILHIANIKENGASPIHRKSFIKKFV